MAIRLEKLDKEDANHARKEENVSSPGEVNENINESTTESAEAEIIDYMNDYKVETSSDGRFRYHYENGVLSRKNGPAVEGIGYQVYYENGLMHRVREPAVVVDNGYRAYYFEGELHRDNGPAVIGVDGYTAYYKHGKKHNIHGPAVIDPFYNSREYWIDGEEYSKKKWDSFKNAGEVN